ncbi:MAG: GNAT family N-acetyltransferase [Anaerolineales bacterium]|nr:GNAT family N-acetyltransferase [Anaerolineales bacterium]
MLTAFVRQASLADHQQLSNLIFFETRMHRHLDWRQPLEWLGNPFYWALDDGSHITAALACPPEAPNIHWIRLFVFSGQWNADNAWSLLWQTARAEITDAGGLHVAAIVMQPWFQSALAASGFESRQSVVMLEWRYQPWVRKEAQGVRLRKMIEADLPAVEEVDSAAFDPLWRNPQLTLRAAFAQALYASVAEDETGVVGYQITTGGGSRAHLARLAVHPTRQGRGIAHHLSSDLLTRLTNHGVGKLSVNTQSDNFSSLGLYERLGFKRTGEQYPVFAFDMQD